MHPTTPLRILALAIFAIATASTSRAQMQVYASYNAMRLPVVGYSRGAFIVINEASRESSYDDDIEVRAAKHFAEGFVTITDAHTELNLLRNASAAEKADPGTPRAQYRVSITADRNLPECFGILTYISEGSVATKIVPIDKLVKDRPEKIEVKLTNNINLIGSLHIFSKGIEIRTSQHPDAYDLIKYYAELVKNVKGLPAVELLKLEEVYPHVLSLDGRQLATVRRRAPNKVLIVYDLNSMKKLAETVVGGEEDYMGDVTWVSDNQLAYIATNNDEYNNPSLYLMDVNKGTTRKVLDHIVDIIKSLPDHPEVLELHNVHDGSLFLKYNVLSGKTYDMEDPDSSWVYHFDNQGKPRIKYNAYGAKRTYEFRPTPTSRWRDLDDLVKQPGLKFNAKASDDLDRIADIHSVGPDGDTLYISSRLESDTYQLAAFSMSQGIIKQTIAKHPKYDLTTANGSFSRLLFEKKSAKLLGMVFEAQKPRVIWIDPSYAAIQKTIDSAFADHVNIPIDWTDDASTFIYFSTSDQDPGTYYLLRTKTGELMPLLQLGERLKEKKLGHTTTIEFKARDGATIPAYLTVPPVSGEKLPPLLVSIHGGPMARNTWQFDPTNQFFATRGYVVLQVNYRGSSGYGASFQAAGLRSRLDTVVIDDIADGVKDLIAKKLVDPKRIAVKGASFGGWATYLCLAKYPDLFRAGVPIAAVSSWKKMQQDEKWEFDKEYAYDFWKSLLDHQDYSTNAKYLDPLLRASEIKQPVLIIHGERDNVVRPMEAKLMLDALRKQGAPVESKSFLYSSHSHWPFSDRVEMLNEIASFLERNLPEDSEEKAAPNSSASPAAAAPKNNPP